MTTFIIDSIENGICFLTESESRHAIKVLRMKNKDELAIINGMGLYGEGEIIDSNPKKTKIQIHELKKIKKPVTLTLAFCPTKNNDRLEWFLEKAMVLTFGDVQIFPIVGKQNGLIKKNYKF